MRSRPNLVALLVCVALCLAIPHRLHAQATVEAPAQAAAELDFIDEVVQKHIDEGKLVGAVVWISHEGWVVHHSTHGQLDRDKNIPMREDAIFRIYSFTKAISNAAAMMLWEEGKYQLDDPVSKYLPAFAEQRVYDPSGNRPPKRPMTVRDLMRHTSGVIYPNKDGNAVEKIWDEAELSDIDTSLEEFADRVAKLPLEFDPGEKWKYGMSVDVLGRLIEVWSGQKFEDFLSERIFEPLEMEDTAFYVPPEKLERLATNYNVEDGKLVAEYGKVKGEPRYVPLAPPVRCSPGGGLFSTAADYGTFLQMILNGGKLGEAQLLKPETIAMMTKNQLPQHISNIGFGSEQRDHTTFGLGFNVVVDETRWAPGMRTGEYGWGGAASCHYWLYPPQQLIVITLEQTTPYNPNLENALKEKIYHAFD